MPPYEFQDLVSDLLKALGYHVAGCRRPERMEIMPEQSVIVWDLETIPDLAAAARMLDLSNAAEASILATLHSEALEWTRCR
jgi:hypothetical protein